MKKNVLHRVLSRALAAPLFGLMRTVDDVDMDELSRIVEKRVRRAENAVIRDYLAQCGVEGDDAERVTEQYRQRAREAQPDMAEVAQLRERAENAERAARQAAVDAEARVQLERLGVPARNHADVLLLAKSELQAAQSGDTEDGAEAVRSAIQSVVERIPGLTAQGAPTASAGSRGNFPRQEDAALSFRHQLDSARAAGDNAAAIGIINSAAEKGIALR